MEDGLVKEFDSVPTLMGRTASTFRRMVTSAGGGGGGGRGVGAGRSRTWLALLCLHAGLSS